MSVYNNGGLPPKNFKQISAALQNFNARHPHAKSQQIEEVAQSKNPGRFIQVTSDVHSHLPFNVLVTFWFTFTMTDGDDTPEEFHIFVDPTLWPDVLILQLVPNGDPAFAGLNPPPPGLPATCVGSYYNPLREPSLTWF